MKIENRVLDVQSTLEGEAVKMTIEEGAMAHIMSVLTDLYSDPELAVLREYATNARDANVEAGFNGPIEVTLPTTLSPYLKIRDYGAGLNAEDIREIYSRYGASTKRDSNDFVGSLGLGCKSALTYTDQFTVQGIKDGICTQIAVSRDEDGSGSMTIVAQYETDEASGVEITVPSKAYHHFESKAEELFRYWPEGSVLVNDEEPEKFTGIKIDEGIYVVDDTHESRVVMGGVPYPATFDDDHHFSVVAFVEIGDVQFTPSREALQMTNKTKNVLADIGTKVTNLKEAAVGTYVAEAGSKPEALRRTLEATRLFHYDGDVKFNGKDVPRELPKLKDNKDYIVWRRRKGRYGRMTGNVDTYASSLWPKTVFITGFTTTTLSITQRAKTNQYMADTGIDLSEIDQFVFCEELNYRTWIESDQVVSFEDIKAIKLTKQVDANGRPAGAYDVLNTERWGTNPVPADELDGTLYWYDHNSTPSKDIQRILLDATPDASFVSLKANRVAKFERELGGKRAADAAREIAQTWFDNLTEDERMFLSVKKISHASQWAKFDKDEIDDPSIKQIVTLAQTENEDLLALANTFAYLYQGEIEAIDMDDYPLLQIRDLAYGSSEEVGTLRKHMTLYLNAVYASRETATPEEGENA